MLTTFFSYAMHFKQYIGNKGLSVTLKLEMLEQVKRDFNILRK